MKPAGSSRVTLATSGLPPQPSTIAVAPSITLTASAEQQLDDDIGVAGVANATSGVPSLTALLGTDQAGRIARHPP